MTKKDYVEIEIELSEEDIKKAEILAKENGFEKVEDFLSNLLENQLLDWVNSLTTEDVELLKDVERLADKHE